MLRVSTGILAIPSMEISERRKARSGLQSKIHPYFMKQKSIVILSSGLDSAVNLAWSARAFQTLAAVTFDYGQRAAKQENAKAKQLCAHYKIKHLSISLPFLAGWTETALVKRTKQLPHLSQSALNERKITQTSAKAVWVPNRNGLFINAAAALAESAGAKLLVVGFNREEAATFPDNSASYIKAVNRSLFFSTQSHVKVVSKTIEMTKREIVSLGIKLKVPFEWLWSCYEGGKRMCGECESCLRLKRAILLEAPRLFEVISFAH